jgi:predicted peptidase
MRVCVLSILHVLACLLLAGSLPAADPVPGTQVAEQFAFKNRVDGKEDEIKVDYLLFVPEQYDGKRKLPLMLFLHGAGERGDDLELVKKWGPPKIVADRKDFPFVVASPQCQSGKRWDAAAMVALVEDLAGRLKVDRKRIYVTGLSMGGYGSWDLMARYPRLFAAGVPICGGGDPRMADALKEIPIWVFHGDKDTAVPLSRSQQMVDAISGAGGEKVTLTIYPGVGHNSWSATYANEKVYDWLLSHRRGK